MKNICIVLCDLNRTVPHRRYDGAVNAFISAGYCFDKIAYLPENDIHYIAMELKHEADYAKTVVLVCEPEILQSVRASLADRLGVKLTSDTKMTVNGCTVFILPSGNEGLPFIEQIILPMMERIWGNSYERVGIREMGASEQELSVALAHAEELAQGRMKVNVSESDGDVRIELIYDKNSPKMIVDSVVASVVRDLDPYIYTLDDQPIEVCLSEFLRLRKLKVSVAESFTGGGVGQRIVKVAGASDVYYEGVNAYNTRAKQERLDVPEKILLNYGAVSGEAAYEMACGLLATGNCDLAISTTGNAGPTSQSADEPVGLCYMAVGFCDRVFVYRHLFEGDRERVMQMGVNFALFHAYQHLRNY